MKRSGQGSSPTVRKYGNAEQLEENRVEMTSFGENQVPTDNLHVIAATCRTAIEAAETNLQELWTQQGELIEYYEGTKPTVNDEYSSTYTSRDVKKAVDDTVANIMEVFGGDDPVICFNPVNPDDVDEAKNATSYINHVFFSRNEGEKIIHDSVKDGCLLKYSAVKVHWEEKTKYVREKFKKLKTIELQTLALREDVLEIVTEEEEPLTVTPNLVYFNGKVNPDGSPTNNPDGSLNMPFREGVEYNIGFYETPEGGLIAEDTVLTPPEFTVGILHSGYIQCEIDCSGERIEYIAPDYFFWDSQCTSLDNASYVGHRTFIDESWLLDKGFAPEQIASLDWESTRAQYSSAENNVDSIRQSSIQSLHDYKGDADNRTFWLYEMYIDLDVDNTGYPELYMVQLIGNDVIFMEPVACHPYVFWTPDILPNRLVGSCPADEAKEIQYQKTMLARIILENMERNNNGTRYVNMSMIEDLDDLLENAPGGIVRVKGDPSTAVRNDTPPPLDQMMLEAMRMLETDRQAATGISDVGQGLDPEALAGGNSGEKIRILTNNGDKRLRTTARNYSIFLRDIFMKLYKILRENQNDEDFVQIAGNWTRMNTAEWVEERSVSIKPGLSRDDKMARAQTLLSLNQVLSADAAMQSAYGAEEKHRLYQDAFREMGVTNIENYLSMLGTHEVPPPQPTPMEQSQIQYNAGLIQIEAQKIQQKDREMFVEAAKNADQSEIDRGIAMSEQAFKQQEMMIKQQEAEVNMAQSFATGGLDEQKFNLDTYKVQSEVALETIQKRGVAID